MKYDGDYSTLLDLFIQLVTSQEGRKIEQGEEWLNDAQTLSSKLFRHLVSMQILAKGATVEQDGTPDVIFVDHASVKVVARAALETYLVFFYLFGSDDHTISNFRHKTWHLGGLFERQSMHASTAEHREKLRNEKQQIHSLVPEIEVSPCFHDYSKKQRTQLLRGKWRIRNDWSDLAEMAGFHQSYFRNVYSYLCGYSHSSYASALQVEQAKSIEDQQMLAQTIS